MAPDPKLESQSVGYYKFYPPLILGQGNFATVYLARHKIVKCDVALKIINTDDIKEEYVFRNLHREEKIIRALHHPNIIRLYEVVTEGNLHCLSLELVRGVNLYQYMMSQTNHSIPEKLARFFFYQMLSAVDYMHNLNVIHRDLKLENILVEYGHIIKIVDFGLSNIYYPCLELRTHCGSIEYAAPELFKSSAYGTAADIWSLGVILYVMVIGKMPFVFCKKEGYPRNAGMRHLFMERISKGLMQDNWELMEKLSPDCWDLLHNLLEPDQFRRIRIEDVFTHPWIMKDKYLMKRLPQKRKDLQRKFHPEVIEYIADKLNTTKSHIETHLNVYQNDKIAAMYFMIRDVLVKEVLHPLKAFENSFLYRFECWRESLSSQHPKQKYTYQREYLKAKEKNGNLTDEQPVASSRDVPAGDSDYKVPYHSFREKRIDDLKLQPGLEMNGSESEGISSKYSVKKICQCTSENVNTDSIKTKEQEKNIPRNPYRSYRKSRPENVNSCKNNNREIGKNNKGVDDMEDTSSNSTWNKEKLSSLNKEFPNDCRISDRKKLIRESDSERKVSNRYYREYSSKMLAAERNKIKHATYINTKTLENETGNNTRKLCPPNIQIKPSLSVNGTPTVKHFNSSTKKIAILKRTEKNTDTRDVIPKTTDKSNTGLQTPTRQPTSNLKKNDETSKNIYAQTPSRIPVKIMQYGPPAPFSQPSVLSTRKATKPPGPNGVEHSRGDIIKDIK